MVSMKKSTYQIGNWITAGVMLIAIGLISAITFKTVPKNPENPYAQIEATLQSCFSNQECLTIPKTCNPSSFIAINNDSFEKYKVKLSDYWVFSTGGLTCDYGFSGPEATCKNSVCTL